MNDFNFETSNTYYPSEEAQANETRPKKGFALASLILGIAAVFCVCFCCVLYPLSIVAAILSIVFAFVARKKNDKKMPGMAVAGLILSLVAILFFALVLGLEIYLSSLSNEEFAVMFEEIFGIRLEDFIAEYEGIVGAPFEYVAIQ